MLLPFAKFLPAGILVSSLVAAPVAFAQDPEQPQGPAEALPILIDVQSGEAGDDAPPLVIAAYQPQPSIEPNTRSFVTTTGRAAIEIESGLPAPSLILGLIKAGKEDVFGIEKLLPATVAAFGFAFDDLEARVALRESDPAMFRALVEQGHIDPPDGTIKTVLQTEFKRMNCYRSRIDGDWGRGSRGSVTEYFNALEGDASWPDQAATVELFREVLILGDVKCVAPVATVTTPRPSTSSRPTTTAAAPPKKPAPAAPAAKPKPKVKPKIGVGIGVFR